MNNTNNSTDALNPELLAIRGDLIAYKFGIENRTVLQTLRFGRIHKRPEKDYQTPSLTPSSSELVPGNSPYHGLWVGMYLPITGEALGRRSKQAAIGRDMRWRKEWLNHQLSASGSPILSNDGAVGTAPPNCVQRIVSFIPTTTKALRVVVPACTGNLKAYVLVNPNEYKLCDAIGIGLDDIFFFPECRDDLETISRITTSWRNRIKDLVYPVDETDDDLVETNVAGQTGEGHLGSTERVLAMDKLGKYHDMQNDGMESLDTAVHDAQDDDSRAISSGPLLDIKTIGRRLNLEVDTLGRLIKALETNQNVLTLAVDKALRSWQAVIRDTFGNADQTRDVALRQSQISRRLKRQINAAPSGFIHELADLQTRLNELYLQLMER